MFQKVKATVRPLPELVSSEIEKLIVSGSYKPGDRLPNEFELAKQLGVGRGTIREATKLLISRNILEIRRGQGTFVCERTGRTDDPLGLRFVRQKRMLGLDLCEVRFMIETQCAMLSAQKATEAEIVQMQALCDEIRELILSGKNYGEKDIQFHTLIAVCTRNSVIPRLIPIITESVPLFIDITRQSVKMETIVTHQAIVDAIRARDPQAARNAMCRHLEDNRHSMLALPEEI